MATVDVSDALQAVLARGAELRTEAAQLVLDSCREDCPVSEVTPTNPVSGTLRDSLQIFEETDRPPAFGVAIGSDVLYGTFTDEQDTDPHEIRARFAPMLRFWWENGFAGPDIYYFKRVWHPGTKGQKWFASKNQGRWTEALAEVVS